MAASSTAAEDGVVLVVGEPGIGKSLTAHRAFLGLVSRHLDNPKDVPVPVFVHLGDVEIAPSSTGSGILDAVAAQLRLPLREVNRLVERGGLLTVLDGLDEAAGLTRAAIKQAALASPAFGTGRVVTARRDFYDLYASMPELAGHFTLIAELERLPFDDTVAEFVRAYCEEFQRGDAEAIIAAIECTPELQDLASRPLTLWMVVDVLADPPADTTDAGWSLTELYRRYIAKWLQREANRPGSIFDRTEDKRSLVRLAARTMFQRGTAVGGALRSTTEMAVNRDQLAEALLPGRSGALIADAVQRLGLAAVLDEMCLRTFLVRGGAEEGYRFAHKSFFEYFVALDMWECTGREARLEVAEDYFARPLSDPIVYFFREMLSTTRARPDEQRLFCQHMLGLLTNLEGDMETRAQTVRQHVGNLLAGVADEPTARILADFADREPSQFVRRGIIVGLALHQGRTDLIDIYVRELRRGGDAADRAVAIQLGYSRIYHGDQSWNGQWEDDGTPEVSRTVEAQIDRLLSNRHRHLNKRLWSLTLFTLRTLLEDGRGWYVLNGSATRRARLIEFLRQRRPEQGEIFEDERRRLLGLLTANDA